MEKTVQPYRPNTTLTARLLIIVLGLAACYNLFPFTYWPQDVSRAPVNVTAVPVGTLNKPIRIERTGSVEASATLPIHSEFSGLVSEVYATEGEAVKAGQPLLKLQGASVSSGDNETPAAAADQKTGVVQQLQNHYNDALKEFDRYQQLYKLGAISRRELENAKTRLQQAQESLNKSQNTISPNANKTAFNGSVTVKAPANGIVTGLSVGPGKSVQAGQQLMVLGSGQRVEIVVHLDQNDLYLVHLGTTAAAEISNQSTMGQVSSIYPEVAGTQIASFLAHIKFTKNPNEMLQPGMPVNVRIDTGQSATVPAVPTISVVRDKNGRSFIYEAVNGIAVRQEVSIGETIGDFTEITSNIPQNTMVITSNVNQIKNGDAVAVMQ
ncbi:rnd efflux pump membrane fusion protein barrel-sandwich domain [Lucifera butyrica]|uniref:Rnd efflux pump membrane fusion protein barrel-sandwich domain n=1 Tax=Lucifera butyrica TaxID=1351585 RepID=A0A498R6V1_9FIRM|nr:efflux RND transporter periplasmic adaptor subunit [Lucifera butyrica]VBB05893.1 rnd efflux pump membrane fusion protein barrel-sandwich domain [Lucifera butyrica]